MSGSLRSLLSVVIVLQTTGLPAMLPQEHHDHHRCICQLGQNDCRHKVTQAALPQERLQLDSQSTHLCNCPKENGQAPLVPPVNLPAIVQLPAVRIVTRYIFFTPSGDLPSPAYEIWAPPS